MKRTRFTVKSMLLVSMIVFLSGTFFLSTMALAADADESRTAATFTASTLILDLPELAVEGTDLLYSTKLQLKQEGENFFLELIELGPCQYQEASIAAATISSDGVIHIPLLQFENNSVWMIDLNLMSTASLLPLKFTLNAAKQIQVRDSSQADDLLGVSKRKCIMSCLGRGIKTCVTMCCDLDGKNCVFYYPRSK